MPLKHRIIAGTIALSGAGIGVATVPVVPVDMKWVVSYETASFETADGDLGMDEYAVAGEHEWYVRAVAKDAGNFTSTTSPTAILGREEVQIRCERCAYYSHFVGRDGQVRRAAYDNASYDALREMAEAPQPEKRERVSILSPNKTEAAIAFDAASEGSGSDTTAVSSLSWSHTTAGDDRLIVVGTAAEDSTDAGRPVTGVTYNSVALTKVREDDETTNNITSGIWYLAAPATGSNTVAITYTGTNERVMGGAVSLTGVDQSSPLDAQNGDVSADGGATQSVVVTTVADNSWVVDSIAEIGGSNASDCTVLDAAQTERWDVAWRGARQCAAGSTAGPKTPAGAQTMSWDGPGASASADWAQSAASFKPVDAGPPPSNSPANQHILWFD